MMFRGETAQHINLPAHSVYCYLAYRVNEELV